MNKYNSDETVDFDFEITFQEFVDSLPALKPTHKLTIRKHNGSTNNL